MIFATLGLAPGAGGQVCAGGAPFARGPVQVSGGSSFHEHARAFGAGVAIGGRGGFGQLGVRTLRTDGLEGSAFTVAGAAGGELSLYGAGTVTMCLPIVSVATAFGASLDYYGDGQVVRDVTVTDFAVGMGMGVLAPLRPGARVVAAGSLSFLHSVVRLTNPDPAVPLVPESSSQSGSSWLAGLTVGFGFNNGIMLHVSTAIPIEVPGASAAMGIGLSVTFGKQRR